MNNDQNQDQLDQNQPTGSSHPIPETPYTAVSESVSETIPPPSSPMVAVSSGGGSIPSWFYLIFGLTVIAFFLVTSLLVFSFLPKKFLSPPSVFSPTPTTVSLSEPTVIPTPVNNYLNELKAVSNSDNLLDIEKDVNQTNFGQIEKEVSFLDSKLDFIPGN